MRHSHAYTLGSAFRRFFDSGASAERAYLAGKAESNRVLRKEAARDARGELGWLRARPGALDPLHGALRGRQGAGLVLGSQHRRLPLWLKRRASAPPDYGRRPCIERPGPAPAVR